MAKTSKFYDQFLKGPNGHASPFVMTDDELTELNGALLNRELGAIVQDPGYSKIFATAPRDTKPVRTIYDFQQSPSVQKLLVTCDNAAGNATELFFKDTSAWTEISGVEAVWAGVGAQIRYETFIGYCIMVGVDSSGNFLTTSSLTGTTFSTSAQVTGAPMGKYVKRFLDGIYIANVKVGSDLYPYRVYRSSVPIAGSITWDTTSTSEDFFDFDFGSDITGLWPAFDNLLVFTKRKTYRYNGSVKKQLWNKGCTNDRTIAEAGGYLFFVDKNGVQVSSAGETPKNVSGKIKDLIKNATPSAMRATGNDEEYKLYLGTTRMNGIAYANCMVTLDVATSTWTWRELGHPMQEIGTWDNAGDDRLILATSESSGQVYDKSKWSDTTPVWTDDGAPITAGFRLILDHLGSPGVLKQPTRAIAYAANAMGLKLRYRMVSKDADINKAKWFEIGELTRFVNTMDIAEREIGNFIQIEGRTISSAYGFSFYGLELEWDEVALPNTNE